MNEKKSYLNQYAMLLGTYMGLFWIAKFCLVPLALDKFFLMMLFVGLTLCVPFMGYYYTRLYRDRVLGGSIGFRHAWFFGTGMYLYATMLTAVAHYLYFAYIDKGFMLNTYTGMLNQLKTEQLAGTEGYIEQMREALELLAGMSPLDLTIQLMYNNVFYGILMALAAAIVVRKHIPNEAKKEE